MWLPVANRLSHPATRLHFGWPGFDNEPADPRVRGIDDLVDMVSERVDRPTALIAQSMGGVVAIRVALAKRDLVTHLVLAVTSGGVDIARFGGREWRPAFEEANPRLPRWFSLFQEDLSAQLAQLTMPTLLLWGDSDPISPVAVGQNLEELLPAATLHIMEKGGHDIAETHAAEISVLIDEHLSSSLSR